MPHAEFEEKQYETAANIELAWGVRHPAVFSSGQVLEEILGYDTAAAPSPSHVIWRVLGVARPNGVRLVPSFWFPQTVPPANRLPLSPVSLVLQFKRPDHLRGAAARQWRLWSHPYFRFERTEKQHQVLRRIEQRVGSAAVVRYAAPAFWRYAELEAHQLEGRVLEESGFVSPVALGSHRVWTYDRPGALGYPNPDGDGLRFESLEELLFREFPSVQPAEVVLYRPLAEHLALLAEAVGYRAPAVRGPVEEWVRLVAREIPELEHGPLARLHDYALVQSALAKIGACWFLTGNGASLGLPPED